MGSTAASNLAKVACPTTLNSTGSVTAACSINVLVSLLLLSSLDDGACPESPRRRRRFRSAKDTVVAWKVLVVVVTPSMTFTILFVAGNMVLAIILVDIGTRTGTNNGRAGRRVAPLVPALFSSALAAALMVVACMVCWIFLFCGSCVVLLWLLCLFLQEVAHEDGRRMR